MNVRLFERISPYLSFKKFDISTDVGRAAERNRLALLSTVAAMGSKIVSVATQLLTIPLTLNYLGTDRFGMWMTMSSIIAMLSFADLGIGNGLLNAISEANGRDDIASIKRHISSATVILSLISATILCTLFLAYPYISWPALFNVHSRLGAAEAGPTGLAFLVCFALSIPATIVQRVQLGLQMGFIANLWQAFGSVLAFIAILIAIYLKAGLLWLVFAFAGAPLIAAVCNGLLFFLKFKPALRPNIADANKKDASRIMRLGFLFFVLQFVVAAAFLSDNLIISRLLGASAVSTYAVPDKMFSIVSIAVGMMMTPLWPAYGEAIARGDDKWVRKILKKSLIISFGVSVSISLFLIVCGPYILGEWVGRIIKPPLMLLIGMALYRILDSIGGGLAAFLNGANVITTQVVVSCAMAVSAIVLKFILIPQIGISGAVWATVISYSLFIVLPYSLLLPKIVLRVLDKT